MKKLLLILAMMMTLGFASQAQAGVVVSFGVGGPYGGYYGGGYPYYGYPYGYYPAYGYYNAGYYPWYHGYYGGGYYGYRGGIYHGGYYGHGPYSHH